MKKEKQGGVCEIRGKTDFRQEYVASRKDVLGVGENAGKVTHAAVYRKSDSVYILC